jgi:TPR repeat protein
MRVAVLLVAFVTALGCAAPAGSVRGPYQTGHTPEADQTDCDADKAAACMRLAAAYDSGLGVPASDERSQALFERACELGDYEGCVSLGVQLDARASTVQPRHVEEGHR